MSEIRISSLSKPLAEGRTAEIYAWGEEQILKLFRDWCQPEWVYDEARIAKAICTAGIPSPAPGEIVDIDGRRGLLYERIQGTSMLEDMNTRPWLLWKHARSLADLQIRINQQTIQGLPSYKNRLRWELTHCRYLGTNLKDRLLEKLDGLPDGKHLCHGDYHPGNVLLSPKGPIVIDWVTASAGSPWVDVARTRMILSVGAKGAKHLVSPMIRMMIELYRRSYLARYQAQSPDLRHETDDWLPIISAARLNEEIPAERATLLAMANGLR